MSSSPSRWLRPGPIGNGRKTPSAGRCPVASRPHGLPAPLRSPAEAAGLADAGRLGRAALPRALPPRALPVRRSGPSPGPPLSGARAGGGAGCRRQGAAGRGPDPGRRRRLLEPGGPAAVLAAPSLRGSPRPAGGDGPGRRRGSSSPAGTPGRRRRRSRPPRSGPGRWGDSSPAFAASGRPPWRRRWRVRPARAPLPASRGPSAAGRSHSRRGSPPRSCTTVPATRPTKDCR